MSRVPALIATLILVAGVRGEDPLKEAQSILSGLGAAPAGGLKVGALPAAKTEAPDIAGRWTAGGNDWDFRSDGTWSMAGTQNRGNWKKTADGIAIQYSGATVWINLKLDGETLVDVDGYIGKARLKRVGK